MNITITLARWPEDIETLRTLFSEYTESLGIDLSFQDFQAELAGLPGKYASPAGVIFLARDDAGQALGCAGLRAFGEGGVAEMKRLYVCPEARGYNLGRWLAVSILEYAKEAGYSRMVLDSLDSLFAARTLYVSLGFVEIEPYTIIRYQEWCIWRATSSPFALK